jgi:hypothetical protein
MFQTKRKLNDALAWLERCIKMGEPDGFQRGASYKLGEMRRALLVKLGRGGEALDSAWPSSRPTPASSLTKSSFVMFRKPNGQSGMKKRWRPRSRANWMRSSSYG